MRGRWSGAFPSWNRWVIAATVKYEPGTGSSFNDRDEVALVGGHGDQGAVVLVEHEEPEIVGGGGR